MRLVIQRVTEASVVVDGEVVGSIGRGLCVLCGIHADDDESAAEWAARKLLGIRLWEANGKAWASSVSQAGLGVLLVSQFTLYAKLKGNKPDFHDAMPPEAARPFWASFVERVTQSHKTGPVQQGRFGAKMEVRLCNDGPVTIELESPVSAPAPTLATTQVAISAATPARGVALLLRRAGAFGRLRSLEARGWRLVGLKTVHEPEFACAVALQAPEVAGQVDVPAIIATCGGAGDAVLSASDRWEALFSASELFLT